MTHHIRIIAWAMGCIVDDIVIVNVPAAQVSERIRFAMLETWFSEPSAHFCRHDRRRNRHGRRVLTPVLR